MPKTSNRLNRISDQLKQELARLIQNELRDPRLGLVSVMEVRVSRDLAHAEVFITVLNAEAKQAVATLNNAGGLLRSLLAKNLNLRATPRLKFVFDESVERGRHLSSLIDQALAQDALHPDLAAQGAAPEDSMANEPKPTTEQQSAAGQQSGSAPSAPPIATPAAIAPEPGSSVRLKDHDTDPLDYDSDSEPRPG